MLTMVVVMTPKSKLCRRGGVKGWEGRNKGEGK